MNEPSGSESSKAKKSAQRKKVQGTSSSSNAANVAMNGLSGEESAPTAVMKKLIQEQIKNDSSAADGWKQVRAKSLELNVSEKEVAQLIFGLLRGALPEIEREVYKVTTYKSSKSGPMKETEILDLVVNVLKFDYLLDSKKGVGDVKKEKRRAFIAAVKRDGKKGAFHRAHDALSAIYNEACGGQNNLPAAMEEEVFEKILPLFKEWHKKISRGLRQETRRKLAVIYPPPVNDDAEPKKRARKTPASPDAKKKNAKPTFPLRLGSARNSYDSDEESSEGSDGGGGGSRRTSNHFDEGSSDGGGGGGSRRSKVSRSKRDDSDEDSNGSPYSKDRSSEADTNESNDDEEDEEGKTKGGNGVSSDSRDSHGSRSRKPLKPGKPDTNKRRLDQSIICHERPTVVKLVTNLEAISVDITDVTLKTECANFLQKLKSWLEEAAAPADAPTAKKKLKRIIPEDDDDEEAADEAKKGGNADDDGDEEADDEADENEKIAKCLEQLMSLGEDEKLNDTLRRIFNTAAGGDQKLTVECVNLRARRIWDFGDFDSQISVVRVFSAALQAYVNTVADDDVPITIKLWAPKLKALLESTKEEENKRVKRLIEGGEDIESDNGEDNKYDSSHLSKEVFCEENQSKLDVQTDIGSSQSRHDHLMSRMPLTDKAIANGDKSDSEQKLVRICALPFPNWKNIKANGTRPVLKLGTKHPVRFGHFTVSGDRKENEEKKYVLSRLDFEMVKEGCTYAANSVSVNLKNFFSALKLLKFETLEIKAKEDVLMIQSILGEECAAFLVSPADDCLDPFINLSRDGFLETITELDTRWNHAT